MDDSAVPMSFWAAVSPEPNTGCWLWVGPSAKGYGRYWVSSISRQVQAHRFAYEALTGPIPTGLQIDHLCRNRSCVNPDHLEAVTAAINVQRQRSFVLACPLGHPYNTGNTYIDRHGGRKCRTCHRTRWRVTN